MQLLTKEALPAGSTVTTDAVVWNATLPTPRIAIAYSRQTAFFGARGKLRFV